MPHPVAIGLVSLPLAGASALLLDCARPHPTGAATFKRAGLRLFVIVTALRAIAGASTSTIAVLRGIRVPYFRLDLLIFSPLCALLAALTAFALAGDAATQRVETRR
jgi:hypothetical protein